MLPAESQTQMGLNRPPKLKTPPHLEMRTGQFKRSNRASASIPYIAIRAPFRNRNILPAALVLRQRWPALHRAAEAGSGLSVTAPR